MAKRIRNPRASNDSSPDGLRTVRINGEAPESRVRTAAQCHTICVEMVTNDNSRSKRRERMWKAYKKFPPTDYSTLVELKMEDQSNVNWGMLAFIINNNMSSFFDMISERGVACDIITKTGTPLERRIYGELISVCYDQYAVREDYDYLINQERSILDMNLFGKGIHMYDSNEGFQSDCCSAREFFVPEDTEISLTKFDSFMRKRKFHLFDLWNKIKDKSAAEAMGWNVEAVLTAMRMSRKDWKSDYDNNEQFLHDISSGRFALTSVSKEVVHVFDYYVREFDGKLSRHMVLQDYAPYISLVNERTRAGKIDSDSLLNEEGFLFTKTGYADDIHTVVSVFLDRTGSGEWHDTPSLAEEIFVQCRQYDITMNSVMDAIKINMTLMLQGQTAESTEKLKAMVWGQFAILPSDMPFVQQRTQLDTTSATQSLQFMMSDLYSGIGSYRVQQTNPGGEAPTATQRQLDAAESAKLTGTQIRRFNEQQTIYHRERYRRFVSLTPGEQGYEQFKKFKDELTEAGVPKAAWEFKNIRSITSNMIAGPGSPSYKLMAAEKIITFTNMTPKDDGQRAAIEDAIAAVAGRQNVRRYMPPKIKMDPDIHERFLGLECESFSDPNLNPRNVQAFPDDNHIQHIDYHMNDMAGTIAKLGDAIKDGSITKEIAMPGITRLMHEGAHIGAHMKFLALDQAKKPVIQKFSADLNVVQRAVEQLQQNLQKIQEQQDAQKEGGGFDAMNDPDIQRKLALAHIEIDTAQKVANIKMSSLANSHEAKDQISKDKAATDIAIATAKAEATAKQPQPKPAKPKK